jgi:L,D-transpeptidase YbiS
LSDQRQLQLSVRLQTQRLTVHEDGVTIAEYAISTSLNGAGEKNGSQQTPRGLHEIRALIGSGAPRGAIFRRRRFTGEICTPEVLRNDPGRDWITTRILWLRGLEPGINRFGNVDTMRRYIYIHGTPRGDLIGRPASRGCIRMRDDDIIELFDRVSIGTRVLIAD